MALAGQLKAQFVRGLSWRLLSKLFSLAATLFLGRYLSAKDFGEMVFIFNLLTFAPALASLGLYEVLLRKKDATNVEISSALNLILIVNFLFYLALFVIISSSWLEVSNKALYYSTLLVLPISSIQWYYNHQLFLQNDSMKLSGYQSVGGVVGAAVALVMAHFHYGIWALSAQVLVGNLTTLILSLASCKILPLLKFEWAFFKESSSEAFRHLQNMVIKNLISRVDRLLISYFFSRELVGLYDFASKFAFNLLLLIQGSLVPLFRSYFYQIFHKEKEDNKLLSEVKDRTKVLFLNMFKFIAPCFFLMGLLAKEYLNFIYGGKWNGAEMFIMYLSLSACIRLFTDFYQTWLSFLGEVKLSRASMIKSLFLTFITAPLLIIYPKLEFLFLLLLLPLVLEHFLFNKSFNSLTKQNIRWEVLLYALLTALVFSFKYYYQLSLLHTAVLTVATLVLHFLFCFHLEKKELRKI